MFVDKRAVHLQLPSGGIKMSDFHAHPVFIFRLSQLFLTAYLYPHPLLVHPREATYERPMLVWHSVSLSLSLSLFLFFFLFYFTLFFNSFVQILYYIIYSLEIREWWLKNILFWGNLRYKKSGYGVFEVIWVTEWRVNMGK